jgi:hypothetical protein
MTLEIYMRSGNVLVLDGVKDWKTETAGDTVTRLELSWFNPSRRLVVSTIALGNIEAICLRRPWWKRLFRSK